MIEDGKDASHEDDNGKYVEGKGRARLHGRAEHKLGTGLGVGQQSADQSRDTPQKEIACGRLEKKNGEAEL